MPIMGLGTNKPAPSAEVVNENHRNGGLPETVTHEQLRQESAKHWQHGATPPREQHDQTTSHVETPHCLPEEE